MSHHCCSPDCECRIPAKQVVLDTVAAVAVARKRGVAQPLEIKVVPRYRRSWRPPFQKVYTRHIDETTQGLAYHWASSRGSQCDAHIILIVDDARDVQMLLRILLHEIEHCIQAESFEAMTDWTDEYHLYEFEYEAAAVAVESEWPEYGYLIDRKA